MELNAMTKMQLRSLYVIETGMKPKTWTEERLVLEINTQRRIRDSEARRHANQIAEKEAYAKRDADRAARKEARGDIEAYVDMSGRDLSEEENKVRYALRKCQRDTRETAHALVAHVLRLQSDPVDALKWADKVYDHVAMARVAKEVVHMYGAGFSFDEVQTTLRDTLVSKSKANSSSSISSDHMDRSMLKAIAEYISVF